MQKVTIRDIKKKDLYSGNYLKVLENLSSQPVENKKQAFKILNQIVSNPLHRIFVAVPDDNENFEVLGSITLLIEPKFIYCGGRVGHIEDVVVKRGSERKGLGKKLVQHAINIAFKEMNCTKLILDCSDENITFYKKFGFIYQDNCLSKFNPVFHKSSS